MKKVLVDTSVWIDFFNSKSLSPEIIRLQELIINNSVCICPVIYQEILQGIKNDNIFEQVKDILSDFSMLNIEIMEVTNYAVDLYRKLRKMGITIRKSADCLIASYAILNDVYLLQKDRDFLEIAKGSQLKILI
ncbi:MAG: PIN domain-containing protein [Prevotellaceae bacterium]|jgi:predicted nucleic acid-binding protein|nr:PIN domain-containing protein [Prevotellaceae bacterium]